MEIYDKENETSHSNIDYDDGNEEGDAAIKLSDHRLKAKNRRRRRSSARFLRLGDNNVNLEEEPSQLSSANLGEVYQNAIRMNAENKINASNSWNLNLIDHLDRFVSSSTNTLARETNTLPLSLERDTEEGGVNFTKASCTLDASVKIYSYRVDDVHLTSYKVLANLNRTETGGKNKDKSTATNDPAFEEDSVNRREKRKNTETETLEQNLANINIAKLDEAFDIDPLFHKMSKTFDEGGAKGLLLANLGVSLNGCNIVFDSTLDNFEEGKEDVEDGKEEFDAAIKFDQNTDINVQPLIQTLEKNLGGIAFHTLPFVPQLAPLREEFRQLEADGFVEKGRSSKRYAAPEEEEIEADRSIHVEAIERSRASQAELGRSMLASDDHSSLGGDDEGPDFDFGVGDDDIDEFVGTGIVHDGDHRFSSSSFQATFEASQPTSQATILLDAIAAGNIAGSDSTYEYFNTQALDTIQGNMWAGSAHWKKMPQRRKPKDLVAAQVKKESKTKPKGKSKSKTVIIMNLKEPVQNLGDLLRQPPRGKKGANPLLFSSAIRKKHAKTDNLLPEDIGLEVESLSTLFMRPKAKIMFNPTDLDNSQKKHVGFGGVETWNEDSSFGGDPDVDGPGFDFGANGDDADFDDSGFHIEELEGVRKVEKVRVGYATVAKKVDVKRLKRDLWDELERTFAPTDEEKIDDEEKESSPMSVALTPATDTHLSFQDTVREMQSTQAQSDVTLPFYFICVLHLANEKGLALESTGLEDFIIHSS